MTRARTSLAGAALVLAFSACGSDGGRTAARPAPSALTDVIGRTYLSTGVTIDGKPDALVDGSQIRLRLDDGAFSTDAGCNALSGTYELDGDRLQVNGLGGTEMGCEPPLMRQEAWLAQLLTSSPTVAGDADRLTLTSGRTVVSLVDERSADPDRPLRDTGWVLDSYGGSAPDAAVGSVPAGIRSTLRLGQRRVIIDYGCNDGDGTYALEGSTLLLHDIAKTRAACADASIGSVERAVAELLASGAAVGWSIDGDVLTLTTDAGMLTYRGEE